jgi:hypothetical protein
MSRSIYVDGKIWDDKLQAYVAPTGWDHRDGLTRTPKMLFERAVTPRCDKTGFHLAPYTGPSLPPLPPGVVDGTIDQFELFMGLHFFVAKKWVGRYFHLRGVLIFARTICLGDGCRRLVGSHNTNLADRVRILGTW